VGDDVRVIGIAGGSASGKTTVAHALEAHLGPDRCVLVSHDRYYRNLPPGAAPDRWNYDHPDALDTPALVADLDALRAGREVDLPVYDFSSHRQLERARWHRVSARPVVIVEGILVLQDTALRARMDRRVFVHTPDDLRLARRIRRDLLERGRSLDEVLAQYLSTVRPMHEAFVAPSRAGAELVLDGEAPIEASVAAVLALLGDGAARGDLR
jgi:uridine kinase